jgi:GntR family transcriptional regulator
MAKETATQTPELLGDGIPMPRVGSSSSLTQQVLEAMVRAIRLGVFTSGRLPPEDELASQMGVSRTTVRRALQSMEQIGLVERRPGRGTKVRAHATPDLLALHGLVPFPTLLRELGYEVASRVAWRRLDAAPPDLVIQLGREVVGGSYDIEVLLLADDSPAVKMVERFPVDVLKTSPQDQDLHAGSILFISERCFSLKIDHALAAIEPRVAGDAKGDTGLELGIDPGKPYLALHETFYSADEVPLATSEVSVNPAYVSFSVFRRFL